ncbi:MAG: cytidine deaminase [Thermoflexales bacterium]
MPEETIRTLVSLANEARTKAYAPYSGYRVGAALLAESGQMFCGANVENASYGLGICAERTAYVKAVSEGERRFRAVAVVTDDGGTPCGACRQFMAEFGLDTVVIVADGRGAYRLTTVAELLPEAFTPANLSSQSPAQRRRTTAKQ